MNRSAIEAAGGNANGRCGKQQRQLGEQYGYAEYSLCLV